MKKQVIGVFVGKREDLRSEFDTLVKNNSSAIRISRVHSELETEDTLYKLFIASCPEDWVQWCGCQFSHVIIKSNVDFDCINRILVRLRLP